MKKSLVIAFLSSLLVPATFAATIQSLTQQGLTTELADKTMTTIPMVTMNGNLINNTVTIYFDKDGQIKGMFKTPPQNGQKNDTGKWVVNADGTLCATWDHWNQNKPICVAVYKLTNSLVFVNHDTTKLETVVLDNNIKTGNHL